MTKPLIGVTSYVRNEENRFTIPARYVESVERAHGIPAVLTPTSESPDDIVAQFDGFVLTGGADVDPAEYGGRNDESVYGVDAERDQFELAVARLLIERSKPLLAICRGIQVLNVALGGTLVEHIPSEYGESVIHRDETVDFVLHSVMIEPESALAAIVGDTEIQCPSYHHQSVRDVAPGFSVCARSVDGVIEAIESDHYPKVIAIQWHPEYVAESDQCQQRFFDKLIEWAQS
ncbi:MAG: gamma-glutamyl-gamma-aminobutyrate hydrolase family protein [Acidiferrobacterales bacterium]|nr:gamma-glutamyl-gamma-aminobutyrate hydrolase family protein [Acidiferrobacterales bacterium]